MNQKIENFIASFNNAYLEEIKYGFAYFRATDFAVEGILRDLHENRVTREVRKVHGNLYKISVMEKTETDTPELQKFLEQYEYLF
jgi:hypothetical protein